MPEFATERGMVDPMAQKLAASVISDILDTLGFRDQVMRTTIRPPSSEAAVVGRVPPSTKAAFWGGLLSTAAEARGARGIVLDGLTRDVTQIARMAFPVFASGISPLDAKGRLRVFAYRCAIECRGVLVESGDIVFGDANGVVVIPPDVAAETVNAALRNTEAEHLTERGAQEGHPAIRGVRETWGAVIDVAVPLDL